MKIAIIGGGIVGSTAAYYLARSGQDVVVFDEGIGQATKAAAGLICPWFSRRRHKAWYRLACAGADFYLRLLEDLKADGQPTNFYQRSGVLVLKKNPDYLQEVLALATERKVASPLMGEIGLVDGSSVQERFPNLKNADQAFWASGAARVDGSELTTTLLAAATITYVKEKATLSQHKDNTYDINGQSFDQVIIAAGAWINSVTSSLGISFDVKPQKGQLIDYHFEKDYTSYPVVVPQGEIDLLPFSGGKIVVGASHEKDKGFDLTPDESVLTSLHEQGSEYYPDLSQADSRSFRVGIRAYTSDYCPFYGSIKDLPGIYVASGLGSSGLTTGPLIGYELAQMVLRKPLLMDSTDYNPAAYMVSDANQ